MPLETCIGYFNRNNLIYTMLLLDDKIIGYINFSAIDKKTYFKLRSGINNDLIIKPENVLSFQKGTENYGYFSSIVINPRFRNIGNAKMLIKSHLTQLIKMADQGVYFRRIIADVISDGGCSIADNLGLRKLKQSKSNTMIYEGILIPNNLLKTKMNFELYKKYDAL